MREKKHAFEENLLIATQFRNCMRGKREELAIRPKKIWKKKGKKQTGKLERKKRIRTVEKVKRNEERRKVAETWNRIWIWKTKRPINFFENTSHNDTNQLSYPQRFVATDWVWITHYLVDCKCLICRWWIQNFRELRCFFKWNLSLFFNTRFGASNSNGCMVQVFGVWDHSISSSFLRVESSWFLLERLNLCCISHGRSQTLIGWWVIRSKV